MYGDARTSRHVYRPSARQHGARWLSVHLYERIHVWTGWNVPGYNFTSLNEIVKKISRELPCSCCLLGAYFAFGMGFCYDWSFTLSGVVLLFVSYVWPLALTDGLFSHRCERVYRQPKHLLRPTPHVSQHRRLPRVLPQLPHWTGNCVKCVSRLISSHLTTPKYDNACHVLFWAFAFCIAMDEKECTVKFFEWIGRVIIALGSLLVPHLPICSSKIEILYVEFYITFLPAHLRM